VPTPTDLPRRVVDAATDAVVVAVGLGVLGVNRVQALRRDVERLVRSRSGPDRPTRE
jgi:hypothetical protein